MLTSYCFLVSCTPDWSLFIYCGPYRWEETDGRKVQRYLDQIRQNAFSTTIEIDNSLSISMLNPPTIKPPSTDNPPRVSKDVNVVHLPNAVTFHCASLHCSVTLEVTINLLVVVGFGGCTGTQLPGMILQTLFSNI